MVKHRPMLSMPAIDASTGVVSMSGALALFKFPRLG